MPVAHDGKTREGGDALDSIPAMKSAPLLLVVLACLIALGGCMSPDDHDFFMKGWINPKDADAPATQPVPMRPVARDSQPGGVVPAARSNDDWSTPAPF